MKKSFVLVTLIDITETGFIRGNSKERDQQRNWETVLQVLSLRTQPIIIEGPVRIDDVDFQQLNEFRNFFGEFYLNFTYPQRFWGVRFMSEQDEIYDIDQLYKDFDTVPIILGLDETARFMLPIVHSYGALKNVHIFDSKELNIN
jgi:hypothetical protein